MNPSYYVLGAVTVLVPFPSVPRFINLCVAKNVLYTDFSPAEKGVFFTLRSSSAKKLLAAAEVRGIEFTITRERGIPQFLRRYRQRFGMLLGILCAVLAVFFAERLVWDGRVTGNERLTTAYVKELLEEEGFGVGSYIPLVNTDRIENRILLRSEQVSWISVNITGNVAEVQIREREAAEEREKVTNPANLVAAKAGMIEEVRVLRGNVVVQAGKLVKKGDLLVSGLYDSNRVGFRYTRAAGQVMARVTDEFLIEIPYEYEGIRYTGEEYCDKSLNFFGFSMNFSKNSRKEGVLYDKISIVENCSLFEGLRSPIEKRTDRYLAYERVNLTRSPAEAQELAYLALEKRLAGISEDGVILRRSVVPRLLEDSFTLYCVVVSVEDIASVSEFEVDMSIVGD